MESYKAAHTGAVVADRSVRGRLRLTGIDRLSYLQGVLTNDVAVLAPGSGCYAALLTPQGRMISDMRVLELGDATLLDLPGGSTARVSTQLTDFVFSEDVVVQDVSQTLSHLVVIGSAATRALSVAPLRPFENRRISVAGVEVVASGNDEFGVSAIDLFVDAEKKSAVLQSLLEAGLMQVEDDILETMRIEAGVPRFGVDMDQDTIPLEAGIEDRAISLTKGCYVGQEVIVRVLHRGHGRVARRLVGLTLPQGAQVPARGERVGSGDRQIGSVTSSTWSPALARPIALGYVHRDFVEPGTSVEVGEQTGIVTALPFTVPATR
ncbi:MAG: glycine cleavage T C-terminal barrel domain-containing protein [Vicinamibacterales bacterium]